MSQTAMNRQSIGTLFVILFLFGVSMKSLLKKIQPPIIKGSNSFHPTQRFESKYNLFRGSMECKVFSKEEKYTLENGFGDPLHPQLLELLQCYWLYPPSKGPIALAHPNRTHFSQAYQSALLDTLMSGKESKLFVHFSVTINYHTMVNLDYFCHREILL